jgi:hypothetical protein
MSKDTQVEGRLYDTRTVERNIKRGLINRKDYEKHLKSLPDGKEKLGGMGDLKDVGRDDDNVGGDGAE